MPHQMPPLLLADITELIGSLVGLAFLVLWVIRQIFEANKQAAPPRGRPEGAAAQQQGGAPAAAGQQADPLRNQVEEFLKRAGRRPPGEQGRPQQAGAGEIEILLEDQDAVPQRRLSEPFRPVEQHGPAPVPQPVAPAPRKARPQRPSVQPRHETVAEHVAETVAARSRAAAERASRLGQQIIEDDHQFDVQLKAKFDHTVGTLTGSGIVAAEQEAAAARAADTPAAHIAVMLASPEGVRQAIVINEILSRPIDRW